MDGRVWIILIVSMFLWGLHIPIHRRIGRYNKIRIPRILAWLAGSRDEFVDWRSFSFQLGAAVFFLTHLLLIRLRVQNFMYYSGALTLISILIVQWLMKVMNKGNYLE